MYIMDQEPLLGVSAADVRAYYYDKLSEQDLADAYAIISNEFWWVEDNRYDFEEETKEYKEACELTGEWEDLMDYFKEKICAVLKDEGVEIPKKGQISVLEPFMKRHGYRHETGWWIKEPLIKVCRDDE